MSPQVLEFHERLISPATSTAGWRERARMTGNSGNSRRDIAVISLPMTGEFKHVKGKTSAL